MRIGIIGAMFEEVERLIEHMHVDQKKMEGKRIFYEGTLFNKQVVVVFSRWGKVAATTTATQLILDYKVDKIIFTGIAGGISKNLHIGDVVIGDKLYQHDMDASPLMPRYEIPLLGRTYFETNSVDKSQAKEATLKALVASNLFVNKLKEYGIDQPKVMIGDIASGDQFINSDIQREHIIKGLPSVVCVEMEGAAVAQVCFDFDIPFIIIRTISDTADDNSAVDFSVFLENIASEYALLILEELLSI